jgi:WD40 repeat protein
MRAQFLYSCGCLAVALVGCSSRGLELTPAPPPPIDASLLSAKADWKNLYVANNGNNTVTVYAPGSTSPLRTLNNLNGPESLAIDPGGDLFVTQDGANKVSVYPPGGVTPSLTISQGIRFANRDPIAVNGKYLAVGNSNNTVGVYDSKNGTLLGTISEEVSNPIALAFATNGDLYVANNCCVGSLDSGTVTSYAISGDGKGTLLRSIALPKEQAPLTIALDGENNLYVSTDYFGTGDTRYSIRVYAAFTTRLIRTIVQGIYYARDLAFDQAGTLYVSNYYVVTEYAKNKTRLLRTIYRGLNYPGDLALDPSANLYVGNEGDTEEVAVYAPHGTKPSHLIKSGIEAPAGLAIGP